MVKQIIIFAVLMLVALVYGTTREQLLAANFEYIRKVGYYYFGSNKNWTDAENDCTSQGAKLAVINSEAEKKALLDFIRRHTKDEEYIFLGYTNMDDPPFVTVDGISLEDAGYSKWMDFVSSGDNKCGAIVKSSGDLIDIECEVDSMPYICEHQLWIDYEFFEGLGRYKMHTEGQSWIEASKTCRSEGSHLAVLDSQEEADAIMGIYKRFPNLPNTTDANVAYIGFRALNQDLTRNPWSGTFLTIFGTSVSDLGYVKWYSTEPRPWNKFFCGVLLRQTASYMMYSCKDKLSFFCEKELQDFVRP